MAFSVPVKKETACTYNGMILNSSTLCIFMSEREQCYNFPYACFCGRTGYRSLLGIKILSIMSISYGRGQECQ